MTRENETLTSIIIPTYNECGLLQDCIYSIKTHTDLPYEIIVVDNGSTDGTVAYLRQEDITFVSLPRNTGFPTACNYGLRLARGDRLLLLNNDVIVGEHWLSRMVNCLEKDESIGVVGPMTNYASGRQQSSRPFTSLAEMAEQFGRDYDGRSEEVRRIVGLCFLFRRKLLDEIGYLDERFSPGHYEDDDFCHRARLAGYKNVIARDTFVYHVGSASFVKQGDLQRQLLERNRKLFIDKWGFDPAAR